MAWLGVLAGTGLVLLCSTTGPSEGAWYAASVPHRCSFGHSLWGTCVVRSGTHNGPYPNSNSRCFRGGFAVVCAGG